MTRPGRAHRSAPPRRVARSRAHALAACLVLVCLVALGSSTAWAAPAVRVSAASSLSDVVDRIVAQHRAQHPNAPAVTTAYAASSTVAQQIERGDAVDVVFTADAEWMHYLAERQLIDTTTQTAVARNHLVIVVPSGSAHAPASVADLANADLKRIAVAGQSVPAGRRALAALNAAGIATAVGDRLVRARNVRAALTLAERGHVDAAIVYGTDAAASNAVTVSFHIPTTSYPDLVITAALTARGSKNPAAVELFALATGPAGQRIFADAGFAKADATATQAGVSLSPGPAPPAQYAGPLLRSLWVAALSLTLSVVPAVALGWLLARREFIGKSLVSTVLMAPLVLPPVVTGFALLELFGRGGPLYPLLSWLGLEVAFTQLGAVVAASVVGFPLLVLMSRLAIESVDTRYEKIAQTLGLTPLRAFMRITLPMALPGLLAGCVLAYARALGEFGATIVLASDVPGQTRTLALAIFALYEQPGSQPQAQQLVWISIAVCGLALLAYEWLGRVQKRRLAA